MYYLLLVGAFLTVFLLVLGLYQLAYGSRSAVLERLKAATAEGPQSTGAEIPVRKGLGKEVLSFFATLGKVLPQRTDRKDLQKKLIQAHLLMRSEEYIGLKLMIGLVLFFVFLLFTNVLVGLVLGLLGFKMPDLFIDYLKTRRMNAITDQLPEALGIISSGLKAGFSFPQAMAVVSREMEPPIKDEFHRVLRDNRMGKPIEETLHDLSERTDSEDLDLFVTALLIQKQVGGNLAEILDNISHTIRERVRIKGEIKTLTAQGRMSAVIITLLPLAIAAFLFVANPEYILLLFQNIFGIIMVSIAVVLMIVGIYIIKKIITIDV